MKWLSLLLLSLSILLSGCGGNNNQSENTKPFIYAVQADAKTLDPHVSTDGTSNNAVTQKIYETLVSIDQKNQLAPQLATEWKQIDPLTWEFTLRKGVKFHDGTDFDANAVKASFDRLLDPVNKKNRRNVLETIQEVKIIDSHKIHLITDVPFGPLLLHLTHPAAAIMSTKAIADDASKSLGQNPVGTGPFKFDKWIKGQEINYSAFGDYWGPKPKFTKLTFKVIPEDSTRVAMVKTGEAQAADRAPLTDLAKLEKDPAIKLLKTPVHRTEFIVFNLEKKPFDDKRVRLAIAEAIDYKSLISGVYQNVGSAGVSTLAPSVFGYNPNLKPYPYDLENAKKLLAEAGYPNGFDTTVYVPDRKVRINLAEVLQAKLKPLGININIHVLEQGTYYKVTGDDGVHDICIDGWGNTSGDADLSLTPTFGQAGIPSAQNISRYRNPEVDQLLDEARAETDQEKRKQIYWKVQEIIYDDVPVIVTQVTDDIHILGKNVQNLIVAPSGTTIFTEVSF